MTTHYELYHEDRCFGNQELHKNAKINKYFHIQDSNMEKIKSYIETNGDKTKSYVILKYTNTHLQWRQLGKAEKGHWSGYTKGVLTNTWERIFYDDETRKWKPTNYRYDDEVIN
jgi:hypothetical protein